MILLDLADRHGVAVADCLAGTGLLPNQLEQPGSEVLPRQELDVIANLVGTLADPAGLGVEAGARFQLTTYGIFGFALISSPTLRNAVEIGLRYLDLTFAYSRIRAREHSGGFDLVIDAPGVPESLAQFVIARDTAAIRTIQRDLLADRSPPVVGVRFAFDPPADDAPYVEALGVRPEFGCAETALSIPNSQLDVPLPRADAHTAEIAQAQCRELLRAREARSGIAGRVQDLLAADPANPPSAARAARELNLSTRTLRHRLAAEGVSYRGLLQEMRRRLAEEMLVTARLTVAETAQRLGYLEVSSFSQAFRRWHGCGPAEYARRRLGR